VAALIVRLGSTGSWRVFSSSLLFLSHLSVLYGGSGGLAMRHDGRRWKRHSPRSSGEKPSPCRGGFRLQRNSITDYYYFHTRRPRWTIRHPSGAVGLTKKYLTLVPTYRTYSVLHTARSIPYLGRVRACPLASSPLLHASHALTPDSPLFRSPSALVHNGRGT
jgi:hypothetical protein